MLLQYSSRFFSLCKLFLFGEDYCFLEVKAPGLVKPGTTGEVGTGWGVCFRDHNFIFFKNLDFIFIAYLNCSGEGEMVGGEWGGTFVQLFQMLLTINWSITLLDTWHLRHRVHVLLLSYQALQKSVIKIQPT